MRMMEPMHKQMRDSHKTTCVALCTTQKGIAVVWASPRYVGTRCFLPPVVVLEEGVEIVVLRLQPFCCNPDLTAPHGPVLLYENVWA